MDKKHFKYGELIPDSTVDVFYNRIQDCILENRKYNHFTENLLKINDNKLPKKIADLIEKHKTVNEEKTNLDKIPTGVKYYLLDWKDRNMDEYIRQYGEQKLRDLSLEQLFELYSYVTTKDGAAMSRLASGK